MTSEDRAPQPPADAYFQMQTALPGWYWQTAPPAAGTLMHVRGRDGVWTQWAMESWLARQVADALARRRTVSVRTEQYGGVS